MSGVRSTASAERVDLRGRSLVSMRGWSGEEIEAVLDVAAELKASKRRGEFHRHLANRNVALVFLKPSTRTRSSFVVAAADEGAHPELLTAADIRFGAEESVEDIARTLGRLFDGIAFRGFAEDPIETLVAHSGVPVWNALSSMHHPTQALADLMTIRETFGTLDGVAVTYVGDGRNNVARSLVVAALRSGLDLRILAPPELQPPAEEIRAQVAHEHAGAGRVSVTGDREEALTGAAVVYGDVWVSMGEHEQIAERIELLRDFKVTRAALELTGREDTIYLHCLPALHDLETELARAHPDLREVDDDVFRGPASRVFDQAENRMHTIKALMVRTLA
ncbi:MAG TPA: ornithine carbamoyltransferase [Thermoleophilaceae bacterium]